MFVKECIVGRCVCGGELTITERPYHLGYLIKCESCGFTYGIDYYVNIQDNPSWNLRLFLEIQAYLKKEKLVVISPRVVTKQLYIYTDNKVIPFYKEKK